MVICHCEGAIYPHWSGISGCEKACHHDNLEVVSECCGAPAVWGVCAKCRDFTGFVKYCPECDTEIPVETPSP